MPSSSLANEAEPDLDADHHEQGDDAERAQRSMADAAPRTAEIIRTPPSVRGRSS